MRLPEISRLLIIEPDLPRLVERLEPEVRCPVRQGLTHPALHEGVQILDAGDRAGGGRGGLLAAAVAVTAFAGPAGFRDDVGGIGVAVGLGERLVVGCPEVPGL